MNTRTAYTISGALVGAATNIIYNLIAAAIQKQAFNDQFSKQSLWWLIGLAVVGLLTGYWLGGKTTLKMPLPKGTQLTSSTPIKGKETVTITRLKALLTRGKLRGKGIHISDSDLKGSWIDIDTKD